MTYLNDGEALEFNDAAEWLDLAASVQKVEVLTGGEDVCYCETVMEYEDARSELLSRVATQLSIFQFAWGAFETVAKIVGPPPTRVKGGEGLINRTACFIKNANPPPAYDELLDKLRCLLKQKPDYDKHLRNGQLPAYMGKSGIGIDFVRKIRNKFAHGAAKFPRPDDGSHGWCGRKSREPELIALCCRAVLLTVQMVLGVYYGGKHFSLNVLEDEDRVTFASDVHIVLQQVHAESPLRQSE